MRIRLLFLAAIAVMMLPAVVYASDVVVIANPSVPTSDVSKQELSSIYLGKKSTWSDGSKIEYVVLKGSAANDHFLREYVGKTDSQFATYWKKQLFTGKGTPPKAFDSDRAMIDFVAKTPGAIGYVSPGAKLANVKTINVQ